VPTEIPKALTIAGSDSSGGAGIQADLKTFAALGVYGCSVITALTAQNTMAVLGVHEVPAGMVALQIDAVARDVSISAVKTGMLANRGIVEIVAGKLREHALPHVVVDPVLVASSGAPLLALDAVQVLKRQLFPLAELITPNIPEVTALLGVTPRSPRDFAEAARALLDLGPRAVMMKGGHAPEGDWIIDWYYDGRALREIRGPRVATIHGHGTGCTYASAIAAGLAKGLPLFEAATEARAYLTEALKKAFPIGKGRGPVHHFHGWWR
jgi:hydroxymethylpyrimidine/phosphomethylpyrimidine kinase